MAWSEAQLAAIETYDKNLLVAAAAGSGKTSVLVERIIRRILDEQQDFQINQVLVVTFTNAAAAEMRARIGSAIDQAIRDNPKSRHLQRQLVLLNAAAISTFHAFCQTVVRQNFHLLDLDPKFRLANEQETNLLKRDVLAALFEAHYDSGDEGFLTFVDHYGNERGDEELYEILLRLYNFSCSQPYPNCWLAKLPEKFFLPDNMTIDDTVWVQLLKEEIRLLLAAGAANSKNLAQMAAQIDFDFYLTVLAQDVAVFEDLLAAVDGTWEGLRGAVYAVKFATLRAPKDTDEDQKAFFTKRRSHYKDKLKWIKENYFSTAGGELIADLQAVQPLMRTICQLTAEFAAGFAIAKQEKTIVDFNDLEHFCLQILQSTASTPTNILPSAAALALQAKYREVMVDEYQDTNGVQEAILSLVRRADRPNLFLVGDVKQSIYRFRLAEPELFLEKYRRYPQLGADFARVDLAQNFRSRAGVLAAINFIFSQVMAPKIAELAYGSAEQLNPGPNYPATDQSTLDAAVELQLIDRDDSQNDDSKEMADDEQSTEDELKGFALEAQFIAERIQQLMNEKPVIFAKAQKKYRPLAWRDIVILLRSVKNKADVLLATLKNNNIPAYANVDSGYFQAIEVQIMLALLQIIDNPQQDIPLASVLYSPIVGLTTEELVQIRLLEAEGVLFAALCKTPTVTTELLLQTQAKIVQFLANLQQWRNLARRKSVPELIWQLFGDTGYYDYVGGMPGGVLRQANLRMLYDRARQYETTNFRGLFRFLRFIEKMRDTGTDLAVARTLGESEDVVRIMSIHKSKGLEFPVVIVADLGKKFNLQDSKATLLLHKKLGLGPYVTNDELKLRYPTLARQAIAVQLNRESKAEELRVLYVALTRAREKLILVGSAAKLAVKANDWCQFVDRLEPLLPDYAIAGADSYLDWLGMAVARHAQGSLLRAYGDCTRQQLNGVTADTSVWQVNIIAASSILAQVAAANGDMALLEKIAARQPLPSSADRAWVERVLAWHYPYAAVKSVPAKLAVTEMKRRFDLSDQGAEQFIKAPLIVARPQFIQAKTKLTGAEYGTIMHSVMQHLNLRGDLSLVGLQAQLADFIEREILLSEQAKLIDLTGIYRYFQTKLGQRMLAAVKIRRELPFSIMLPAQRFYPDLPDDTEHIFVQGIVDVLFDEADGMVLLDYKTDGGTNEAALAAKYKIQLNLYAEAVAKIFGRVVKEKYLYLFSSGRVVTID